VGAVVKNEALVARRSLANLSLEALKIGGLSFRCAMTINGHSDAHFGKDTGQFLVQRLEVALIPFAVGGYSNAEGTR
jgi:hypothetical protein